MRREGVGQHNAQPKRKHRQDDAHARLLQTAENGIKQEQEADADVAQPLGAQVRYADGKRLRRCIFEEHKQQRLGENRHERGNNQAEAAGKQERCADAVTEALRLIRPLILGDEGREAVAEVLRGAVRQRVNLHAGGECRHRRQTEAVHETLHTQDAEIHDGLLNAGHGRDGEDAPEQRTVGVQVVLRGRQRRNAEEHIT